MEIAYPFRINERGHLASVDEEAHIREMIEQVLFTNPGERVNRPDFGCGLNRLVFASPDSETVTATQGFAQGALQQWLGDVIQVEGIQVEVEDSMLTVLVQYTVLRTQHRYISRIERSR